MSISMCGKCGEFDSDFSGNSDGCSHCGEFSTNSVVFSNNKWVPYSEWVKGDSDSNSENEWQIKDTPWPEPPHSHSPYEKSKQEEPFDPVAFRNAVITVALFLLVVFIVKHIVTICHVVLYCIAGIIILNLCAVLIYEIYEMVCKKRKNNSKRIKTKTGKPSTSVPSTQARCSASPIGRSCTITVRESKCCR